MHVALHDASHDVKISPIVIIQALVFTQPEVSHKNKIERQIVASEERHDDNQLCYKLNLSSSGETTRRLQECLSNGTGRGNGHESDLNQRNCAAEPLNRLPNQIRLYTYVQTNDEIGWSLEHVKISAHKYHDKEDEENGTSIESRSLARGNDLWGRDNRGTDLADDALDEMVASTPLET